MFSHFLRKVSPFGWRVTAAPTRTVRTGRWRWHLTPDADAVPRPGRPRRRPPPARAGARPVHGAAARHRRRPPRPAPGQHPRRVAAVARPAVLPDRPARGLHRPAAVVGREPGQPRAVQPLVPAPRRPGRPAAVLAQLPPRPPHPPRRRPRPRGGAGPRRGARHRSVEPPVLGRPRVAVRRQVPLL